MNVIRSRAASRIALSAWLALLAACSGQDPSSSASTGKGGAANKPPIVNAGADQSVQENTTVTLSGTATDPDGTIKSVQWKQVAGPKVTLADKKSLSTTFDAPEVDAATTLTFELTAQDDQGAKTDDDVTITVNDTTVSIADQVASEADGVVKFTLTISPAHPTPITVQYTTADGTARSPADYAGGSGSVTIPAGVTSAELPITVVNDTYDENDETFTVTLTSVSGSTIGTPTATGTIQDDDDSNLLRIGAAKHSIQPCEASVIGIPGDCYQLKDHIAGVDEERAYGAGTHHQQFNLGGFGINLGQNLPDPGQDIPGAITTTQAASRRVFNDHKGVDENTNLRLFIVQQKGDGTCDQPANGAPATVETCTGGTVVFAMIDAIGAGNLIVQGAKDAIIAAATAKGIAIAPENILFGMTHSHTAADLQGLWGGVPQDWVQNILYKAAGDAMTDAIASMQPAHLSFKQGYTTDFNNYRRPRIDPNADADGTITLLSAVADDGTPIGNILQYNAHPTTVGDDVPHRTPHSEYILGAMDWLEHSATGPGGVSLYYNGPIADASPSGSRSGCVNDENNDGDSHVFGDVRCRGEGIADYLLHADHVISGHELSPSLVARSTTVVLPITNPAFAAVAPVGSFNRYYNFTQLPTDQIPFLTKEQQQDLPQVAPIATTTVSRITLGGEQTGLEIVSVPGETTNTNGDYIRGLAKTNVMLLGLTHNSFGYILPEQEFMYVAQDGDDGFVLPFTGYEENVSLGPLTATLLRAEGYNQLFSASPEKNVPPALSSCLDASGPTTCELTVLEERINLAKLSVERCLQDGWRSDSCFSGFFQNFDPIPDGLDSVADGCSGFGGPDAFCGIFSAAADAIRNPPVPEVQSPSELDTRLTQTSADAALRGCDILDSSECLFPFPSDHFLVPAAPDSPQGANKGGTGKRVNFNILAMPRNAAGRPIDPTEWNRQDGFSPGQLIVTYVPNIGTVKDANHKPIGPISGAPAITDIRDSLKPDASIMVIDATEGAPEYGQQHPIYAEIDLNAGYLLPMQGIGKREDKKPALLIRAAKNYLEGHRYVVALRDLKNDYGAPIAAGPAFTACRDHAVDDLVAMPVVQQRCAELENDKVWEALTAAGVARDSHLYLAWNFTVASAHNDVARLIAMRDDAFKNYLGDTKLSEPGQFGYPGGRAPKYTVSKVTDTPDSKTVRRIEGYVTVPSYLVPMDAQPLNSNAQTRDGVDQASQGNVGLVLQDLPPNRLYYLPDASSASACDPDPAQLAGGCAAQARYGDGLPDRVPGAEIKVRFTCNIPRSAIHASSMSEATAADVRPVRPTLYGHGLVGSQEEGNGQASEFGNVYGLMTCMTNWGGFSENDVANIATILADVSNFPTLPDASQQGVLGMMFLARLAVHPDGFAADPNFQVGGVPVFDRREVFYHGNSQGGIMGGVLVAASKDINRGVIGVLGMNYSTLLMRSTDFAGYSVPLFLSYQDDLQRPEVLSLMQMLWDRAENDGYADAIAHNDPELKGPPNALLLQPAIGDHQVSMWTAEVMARTLGAKLDRHRVRPERHPDVDAAEYYGLTPVDYAHEHWSGSALVPYDQMYDPATGTEHWNSQRDDRCDGNSTEPPPVGNVPPERTNDTDAFVTDVPTSQLPTGVDTSWSHHAGDDPHECPRRDPQARCQMSHFLQRVPAAGSGDTAPELVDVKDIVVFGASADTDAGCPPIVNTVPDQAPPPPPSPLPAAPDHGLTGCLISQDPDLCANALSSLQNLQNCSFDESGFNCAFDIAYDAIGVDTAAATIHGLFEQCAASPLAPACEAIRSSGGGAAPDRIIVASTMIPRGTLDYLEETPAHPSAKTVDGNIDDWMGAATKFGGTDIYQYGEHVYSDYLFDAYGADDGDDARRLAVLALTGDVSDRLGRLDALQQAAGDQLGVPQPIGSRSDHYGDATNREDGTDLTEVRWAADDSNLFFLARVSKLLDPASMKILILADTDDTAGMNGLNLGLTTSKFDRAIVLDQSGGQVINLVTGTSVSLAAAHGSDAVSAAGYDNALEASIPRGLLQRPDGKIRVAVMTLRGNTIANVAYRFNEPVTIYSERAQAMALFAGTVDPFIKQISVADLTSGRTQAARPGTGYFERQFVSGENISNEADTENGRLQPYGLYVPAGVGGDALNPARMTIWTHYRGGKAHSGAAWTPRLFHELGDEQHNIVVSPRARGTSTWYVARAHQDFFEVFADVAGRKALRQYASENLPADNEAGPYGLFSVDPAHIYVSGYSMGGYATYLFTGLYPDLFAAGFSQSGAVTQGAWTGVIGPDDPQCTADPQEIPVEGDSGNPCMIEANEGRADAQLNYRILDNTRYVPLEINHGTNDELALTPGAVQMGAKLAQLGYRYDQMLLIGYEHYTQAIMDEWADGAHYINRFAAPENPRTVTYKVVPALVKAVNEVHAWDTPNATFTFHPDGAYWVDDMAVRDGADGDIPKDTGVVPFGQIDAESGRIAGNDHVAVPRTGTDVDEPASPYVSTPAYSPGNHTTPFVRSGFDWVDTTPLADESKFSAILTNLSHAKLDLARMGFTGHFNEAIDGDVTSDGTATLTLARVGADMTLCVNGAAAGNVSAGSDATVTVASGATAIHLVPGLGASCGSVTPPPPPPAASGPDLSALCASYGVSGSEPVCAQLLDAETQLREQCESNGGGAFCTLANGNLHALADACAANNPGESQLPVCRVIDALMTGAAAYCRQVSMATRNAQRPELCALVGGVTISEDEVAKYEASWTHKALTLQNRLGYGLSLVHNTLLHTHNSFNATDNNTPPTISGSDYNQYYSITDQLRMDIRAIEMDVHWMPGRDADPAAIAGGNTPREPMLCHGEGPDRGNLGCTTEKPLREGLAEFRAWLVAHPDDVVMLYIEDDVGGSQPDEAYAYQTTAGVIDTGIGDRVYRPAAHGALCNNGDHAGANASWLNVTRQQILDAGKQVLLITENCPAGQDQWNALFHQKNDGNWRQGTQDSYANIAYPACAPSDATLITGSRGKNFSRVWEDSTLVTTSGAGGLPDGNFTPGGPARVTPAVMHELVRCGANLPGVDRLYPADGRLEAAVWSWAKNEPIASATLNCAALNAQGRFFAADCAQPKPFACVSNSNPDAWQVTGNGAWSSGAAACPSGTHFSVPANGYANEQLKAATNGAEVWLNYSDASNDGQWLGDAAAPPPVNPDGAPPDSGGLGGACRRMGAPDALCSVVESLSGGVSDLVALLTSQPAYDQCDSNTGLCLSQLPVVGNIALNVLDPVLNNAPRGVWLKGDMHVHDDHSADGSGMRQTLGQGSPGNVAVGDQIAFAENVSQLDFLPLTDHRTYDQHYDPLWKSSKLLLIRGEEANGSPHANVFGALDMINQADNAPGQPDFHRVQQSIWDAHLQGAAWQTNHPDDGETVYNGDGTVAREPDGEIKVNNNAYAAAPDLCEMWNRGTLNGPKIEYCESRWNHGWRMGIGGASDDHFRELWPLAGPGEPTTLVFASERSTPALLEALRAGHTTIRLNAAAPQVTFDGDFDGDGSFETVVGDEVRVAPGAHAKLRVTITNGVGTHLYVYRAPGLKAGPFKSFQPTLPVQRFTFDVTAPAAAAAQDWYRVEVRGPGDPDALDYNRVLDCLSADTLTDPTSCQIAQSTDPDHANPLRAVSSPIFVSTGALAQPQSPELPADTTPDDGATATFGSARDNAFAGFGSIAEANGMVHTVAEVRDAGASKIFYRHRDASGVFGEPIDLAPASRLATQPRVAALGNDVWVVWQDSRDGELPHRPQIYARHSTDGGYSWLDEQRVSESSGRAEMPALALLDGATPVIVWQDNSGGAFDVMLRALGRDNAPVNLSSDDHKKAKIQAFNGYDTRSAIYPASVRPSVAVSAQGAIAVAWQDNTDDVDPGWTGHMATPQQQADSCTTELQRAFNDFNPPDPTECGPPGSGTQTDDWEIYSRVLAPGASAWSVIANVSHASTQADRNVTVAFDASGALRAAWDTKTNDSMAGPRLSIRTRRSVDGVTWTEAARDVALDAQYSSQRPVFGQNGDALSLFWMDGRSADWRWRVMRADAADDFATARFVTTRGNSAWPSFSNGWLAFTSDRNATREQRKPQQVFALKLEDPAAPAATNNNAGSASQSSAFDLCVMGHCLSGVPTIGPAVLAVLEPVLGPDPNPTTAIVDPVLAQCHDRVGPQELCNRVEDLADAGDGLSRWVDPRIGSHPPGFTNPGPAAPYGMVELGPDTEGPINYGGYYGHNALITGFSHVHMSAGVYKGGYFPVLPFTGTLTSGDITDVTDGTPAQDHPIPAYASTFDHASETAEAGYYSVFLSRYAVRAEFSATPRAGMHQYTFTDPQSAPHLVLDVGRTLSGYHDGLARRRADGALSGWVDSGSGFKVYFAARLQEDFTARVDGGRPLDPDGTAQSGNALRVIIDITDSPALGDKPVHLQLGLSYTSEDGALHNLDTEMPQYTSIVDVRNQTRTAWDKALASIQVEGGTIADRISFYTALYHAQQFPNLHSDVNHDYLGPDLATHNDGRDHYSQFSSWDSYRGQNQLQAEIAPVRYNDMVNSVLRFGEQNGNVMPRWQEGPKDAAHMSGDPIIPFVGEAWCRGALDGATKAELWPQLTSLVAHRDAELAQKGYLSVGQPDPYFDASPAAPLNDAQVYMKEAQGGGGRAGTTLEYGIADFSLALMAQAASPADAAAIAQRSLNYRNLFDSVETKFIRPRLADGRWLTPYRPEFGYGFQEGTSWQYSWLAMHDYAGMVSRMGGDAAVNDRLDAFFNFPVVATTPIAWPAVQNQMTAFGTVYAGNQYAPGNEMDLEAPYVYNYTGAPWKAQAVARAAASIYTPTSTGMPGNDDLGALSGWLVWAMAGVYPINPGTPLMVIGSPVFEKVTFHRPTGDFVIRAPGASAANKYVQSAVLDGRDQANSWFVLPRAATTLQVALGATPNTEWASAQSARPPSLTTDPLAAFGCETPAAGVTADAPQVAVNANEVTMKSAGFSRTWSRQPFRTERLVDERTGRVWSENSADFAFTIGGAEITSDKFEIVGTPSVQRLANGVVRTSFTLAPSGASAVPVGVTLTRVIELYPGVAGMRSQTWLNTISPLAISDYSLDEARPQGTGLTGTIHSFRAGGDWRDPDWTGPTPPSGDLGPLGKQQAPVAPVVGDPNGGDWRATQSGASVSGTAQWMSIADAQDRRLFFVMERNDYASSQMSFAGGRARAHVDVSRDVIYLGPLEETGHVQNPGPGPARTRIAQPGVPLRFEPVFTGFGTSGDDEPWQHYKYLADFRTAPYRREVTFNSNGVDGDRISTGAKDDMDLAETQRQAAVAKQIGIETFVLDDGWQARSGDWCPDTDGSGDGSSDPACVEPRRGMAGYEKITPRFPDATFAAVRQALGTGTTGGMNLGLWMSPLHFHPSAIAFQNNPQWACMPIDTALLAQQESDPDGGSQEAGVMQWNLEATGPNGKAVDYIESRIRRAIDVYGVKYFKFDFTVWLDCAGVSTVDMYGYRESFMAMLDRVLGDHPDVTIQMDETNDYRLFPFEALVRGPTWYQNGSPSTSEALHATQVLAPFLPPYALGRNALNVGRLGTDSADYQMAVAMLSHVTFFNSLTTIPDAARTVVRDWTNWYKAHRADVAAFTYPLLGEDPIDPANWAAFQAWNPETGRGVLLAYRQDSTSATKRLRLRNVPAGTYRLTAAPSDAFVGQYSAEDLRAGIDITLSNKRTARVLRIERVN